MLKCQNCGNTNTAESHFCRFCGTSILNVRPQPVPNAPPADFTAPKPYSWKTGEFDNVGQARSTIGDLKRPPMPLVQQNAGPLDQGYRCPHCMSQFLPRIERRVATAGWVVFGIMIATGFLLPFCWAGLFIKEDVRKCPSCGLQVG